MQARRISLTTWQRDLTLVVLPALVVFGYCAFSPLIFTDGDTNWHLAAGRWILEHRAIPLADPFSYTAAGRAWTTHEWLAEVAFALAYAAAGWSGIALLTAAAAAALTAILAAELRSRLDALSVVVMLGTSFILVWTILLARPHVLALPVLAAWTVALLHARRQDRAPSYWLLPLMLLWANLHASYIVGLATASVFALEAFLGSPGRRVRTAVAWGLFLVAATAMALATPHGVQGLLYPFQVTSMETLHAINEWRSADFATLRPLEAALILTLFVCLYRGVRMSAVRLAFLLLLVHMALQHVRQVSQLAVLAPLLLVDPIAAALNSSRSRASPAREPWTEAAAPMAVAALLFVGLAAARVAQPIARVDSRFVPVTAAARTPAALAGQPVFNDYGFGGWLILQGRRPFIDGRADMYGDAFVREYLAIAGGDPAAFDQAMRRYRFRWTILSPQAPLVKLLDGRPEWRRLYADRFAVVHVYTPRPTPRS